MTAAPDQLAVMLIVARDLGAGLAIGLLIGLERGWSMRDQAPGGRVAGFRTFGLTGLSGALAGLIAVRGAPAMAAVLAAGVVAMLALGHWRDLQREATVSATAMITALIALALGFLAASGFAAIALACAAVVTLLLASREALHGWIAKLGERDIQASARFAIIALAVLPFLPDRAMGPYGAWNPQTLWLVVILVTGFSFAGYICDRWLGPGRGTLATAVIGGLYSSTAVIASLSQRLRGEEGSRAALNAGIALASAVMFLRVLVLVAILAPSVLPGLAKILAAPAVVAAGFGGVLMLRMRGVPQGAGDAATPRNPFELVPALGFAAAVAVMAVASRWAQIRFGDAGLATMIALGGSMDVDAAIVTLGGLPAGTLSPVAASLAVAVPVLLNTLFKAAIVFVNAGWARGRAGAAPLLAAAIALIAAALVAVL